MFPALRFSVSGLNPTESYAMMLEFAPADDNRYKFANGRWVVAGRADPFPPNWIRFHPHPDNVATGEVWMRQPVSFHKVKLCNSVPEDSTAQTNGGKV